jgi:CrcB protein
VAADTQRFFVICAAGAAGTGARYLIALWAARRIGLGFPYGTLMVNLAGCFAIAAVMHIALTFGWPTAIRTAITVGFLGGFTTYSSFNYETMRLAESGAMGAAAANAALTIVGGFAAGWIGLLCARGLIGR